MFYLAVRPRGAWPIDDRGNQKAGLQEFIMYFGTDTSDTTGGRKHDGIFAPVREYTSPFQSSAVTT